MLDANIIDSLLGVGIAAGLGAIGFTWERMRRDLNLALPAEQKVSIYPSLPKSLRKMIFRPNDLGHFINVLDQYEDIYPHSGLPKKLALGVVVWIFCFLGLLAAGVGH
jgi:hypothetical protein